MLLPQAASKACLQAACRRSVAAAQLFSPGPFALGLGPRGARPVTPSQEPWSHERPFRAPTKLASCGLFIIILWLRMARTGGFEGLDGLERRKGNKEVEQLEEEDVSLWQWASCGEKAA